MVHHTCITCASHVHHMCITRASHVHHTCITCASHVHHMCITCASHDDGGWSWHVSIVFSSRLDNHHTGAMTDSLRFYCFMLLPSLSTALQQVGCIAGTLSYLGGSAMTSVTCKLSAWDASASGREKKLLQRCPTGCPLWHWSRVGHMQACRLMSCALSVVSELSALQTFLFYLVKL